MVVVPSNAWNRCVYRMWAPVYDAALERLFRPGRAAASRLLSLRPGERVVLVGVGTGQDLDWIPAGVDVVGVDLSPHMMARARQRAAERGVPAEFRLADAADTGLPSGAFDAAVLGLVLSVMPDPRAGLTEARRLVRPGGRAVVFDKFAPEGAPPSPARRALNVVTRVGGTDIGRRLSELLVGTGWRVERIEPSILRGQYRVVLLTREPAAAAPTGS